MFLDRGEPGAGGTDAEMGECQWSCHAQAVQMGEAPEDRFPPRLPIVPA